MLSHLPIAPQSLPFHPKYEQQLIFVLKDFFQDSNQQKSYVLLEQKLYAKATRHYRFVGGTHLISLIVTSNNHIEITPALIRACQMITARTRIYIDGHCSQGSKVLATDRGVVIKFDYLAKLLTQHIPRDSTVFWRSSYQFMLKISLSSCAAGLPDDCVEQKLGCINNSFAAQFSAALHDQGIFCLIAARLGTVYIDNEQDSAIHFDVLVPHREVEHDLIEKLIKVYEEQKNLLAFALHHVKTLAEEEQIEKQIIHITANIKALVQQRKMLFYPPKEPYAKAIYYYDEFNQQKYSFAYQPHLDSSLALLTPYLNKTYSWRDQLIDTINQRLLETKHFLLKAEGLIRLLEFIVSGATDQQIYRELCRELAHTDHGNYDINLSTRRLNCLLQLKTTTHHALKRLVKLYELSHSPLAQNVY